MKLFFGTLIAIILAMFIFDPREEKYDVELTMKSGKVDTIFLTKEEYEAKNFNPKLFTSAKDDKNHLERSRIPMSKIKSYRVLQVTQFP